MAWFGFALFGALLMAGLQYATKFLIEEHNEYPFALLLQMSWALMTYGVILWLVSGRVVMPVEEIGLLLLAGAAPAWAGYFFFQALSRSETSYVVVVGQINAVFVLILSVIFLHETLTLTQLLGFALVLIAVVGISLKPRQAGQAETHTPWAIIRLLVISNLILAVGFVLSGDLVGRLVKDFQSLTVVTAYTSVGFWCGTMSLVLLFPNVRRGFLHSLPNLNRRAVIGIGAVELFFVVRQFVVHAALFYGPTALVSIILSMDGVFTVIMGWLLSLWLPLIFKEDISRATLWRKIIWAVVAFVGVVLIQ